MTRAPRDFTQGAIRGELDTGKGFIRGELSRDEIDSTSDKTQPLGRFKPQRRLMAESNEGAKKRGRHRA